MLAFLLSTLESNEDKEIFTKIYVQYRPLMERTATRILKEPSDIEDWKCQEMCSRETPKI